MDCLFCILYFECRICISKSRVFFRSVTGAFWSSAYRPLAFLSRLLLDP